MGHKTRAVLATLALAVGSTGLAGCGYYGQAVRGHMDLVSRSRPIDDVIDDPETSPALAERLRLVLEARRFAFDELGLPDNGSYLQYADLERRFVVWNVFAAPVDSLTPRQWCFPVAGCVVYRGYFREDAARSYARGLEEEGFDVHVGGASAYSTVGWFKDPVVSTMLTSNDGRLVGLLFHELAHQRLYVKDHSEFNEAFASLVEEEGVRRWFAARGGEEGWAAWRARRARDAAVQGLLEQTRAELAALYADPPDPLRLHADKQAVFDTLRERYRAISSDWPDTAGYDAWFAAEWNNARLVPVGTYRRLVPAFRALLREEGGDLARFYERCESLGELPGSERDAELARLLALAPGVPGTTR
jgi:predicted aminopeptidase